MVETQMDDFLAGHIDPDDLKCLAQFFNIENMAIVPLTIMWNTYCEHFAMRLLNEHPDVTDLLVWDERTETKIWAGNRDGRCLDKI